MLKKTLVAAAVTMGLSAGAFADVHIENNTDWEATKIAKETKQSALNNTTASQDLELMFDNPATDKELRKNGYIVVQIKDGKGADFNLAEIGDWLTTAEGTEDTLVLNSLSVDLDGSGKSSALSELKKVFKFRDIGNSQHQVVFTTIGQDEIRLTLADDVETNAGPNTLIDLNFSKATNAFKLKEDTSGKAPKVYLSVGAHDSASYTADLLDTDVVFDQSISLFSTELDTSGKATALVNTYFENYKLGLQQSSKLLEESDDENINGVFAFDNNTTNQNIQREQVRFTISGDFSGFKIDGGELLGKGDARTGWFVNADKTKAARYLGNEGTLKGDVSELQTATLYHHNDSENDATLYGLKTPISSGSYSVKAELAQFNRVDGKEALFTPVSEIPETDSFYPVTSSVEKIIEIDRDGMKFDTITTGSTSSNNIFIRDVSNRLGEQGGKILVTIYEYEAMGADTRANATGNVDADNNNGIKTLVHRKALQNVEEAGKDEKGNTIYKVIEGDYFTLPSGGAVNLTPAGVARMAGVDVAQGRQARFVFEVQTNMGEVAVRKKDDSGTDIQNGTRNVNRDNGDNGTLVDFTL